MLNSFLLIQISTGRLTQNLVVWPFTITLCPASRRLGSTAFVTHYQHDPLRAMRSASPECCKRYNTLRIISSRMPYSTTFVLSCTNGGSPSRPESTHGPTTSVNRIGLDRPTVWATCHDNLAGNNCLGVLHVERGASHSPCRRRHAHERITSNPTASRLGFVPNGIRFAIDAYLPEGNPIAFFAVWGPAPSIARLYVQ